MKTRIALLLTAVLLSAPAFAQIQINIGLPTLRFEVAPPLVVVSPGIQVVPDYHEEVFFTDGWYWVRQGDNWYQARDYRGGWVVVERKRIPPGLVRIPPGQYKKYRGKGHDRKHKVIVPAGIPSDPGHGPGHGKHKGDKEKGGKHKGKH